MSLTTDNHPYEATFTGIVKIENKATGKIYDGPRFSITMTDNCCEGHAEGAAMAMAQEYCRWNNDLSVNGKYYKYTVEKEKN